MASVLLSNADVILADRETKITRGSVLVEEGVITRIGENERFGATRNAETIDCSGLLLMPGLVNAHTHLFQVLTRGIGKHLAVREWAEAVTYPMARRLDAEIYYNAVLLACADAIRNGTTAVIDHPTHYARFLADESVRAVKASGLRGAVARGGADRSLVDLSEIRALKQDLAEAETFVKRWGTEGKVRAWVGPSGFHTCTPHALREFKQLSKELGTRFHMHLAESAKGREEAQAAGYAGEASHAAALGLLDPLTSLAHVIWISEEDIAAIASSGCQVVHCPTSNQILASGIAPLPTMVAKGILPALATDGPSSNDSLDMVAELKSAALLHRIATLDPTVTQAREVLFWATEGGAKVLGCEKLGRLAPGFAADIVGLRVAGNPSLTPCEDPYAALVFYASGRDVAFVMVEGRTLYRDGRFTTLDVERICAHVSEYVRRGRSTFPQRSHTL